MHFTAKSKYIKICHIQLKHQKNIFRSCSSKYKHMRSMTTSIIHFGNPDGLNIEIIHIYGKKT